MDILIIFFLPFSRKTNDHKPAPFRPLQRLNLDALIKFPPPGFMHFPWILMNMPKASIDIIFCFSKLWKKSISSPRKRVQCVCWLLSTDKQDFIISLNELPKLIVPCKVTFIDQKWSGKLGHCHVLKGVVHRWPLYLYSHRICAESELIQLPKKILPYIRNGHWENRSEELNNKAELA